MMRSWLRANRGFLLFLLLLGVFRTAVADWNPIPSASMRPTLLEGDLVFVDRLAYDLKLPLTDIALARLGDPRRGDIVTFSSPRDGTRLIKRIVALPGDTLEMRDKKLLVNGRPADYGPVTRVDEPAGAGLPQAAERLTESIDGRSHIVQWFGPTGRDDFGPVHVPADHFLMLGDNRDNSADSRYFGLVPRPLLLGRAVRVLGSLDILDAWQPRLRRFGQAVQ